MDGRGESSSPLSAWLFGGSSGEPPPEGSRSAFWVPAGIAGAVLVLAVGVVAFSLGRPVPDTYSLTSPDPDPVGERLVGPVTYTIDTAHPDRWVYFDFSLGSEVWSPDPDQWDLAFRRFDILVNGGESFQGEGGVRDLGRVPFDSLTSVPDTGYAANTVIGRDTVNTVLEEWYSYRFAGHLLEARPRVFAIRTADGRYAKLEFLSYYCDGPRPACLTFRYVYQGGGGTDVAPGGDPPWRGEGPE